MQRPIEGEELDKTFSPCTVDLLCRISTLRAVVSPGRTLRERNHCEQPWFSIEHARAHNAYVKPQMTSLPLDSRENYDLCMAGPGSGGVDRKS